MFENIQKIARRVSKNIDKVSEKAIKESTIDMADMNVNQMMNGLNADGDQIGEYRSVNYAAFKQRLNPAPPPMTPDLRLTGSFHSGLFAKYTGNDIIFGSTDRKSNDLATKYGANIFGLTESNQEEIKEGYIFPIITTWLSKELQKI